MRVVQTRRTQRVRWAMIGSRSCGMLRHIAAKTIQHVARAAARDTGISANATLVLNECWIMKFLSQIDKTDFITTTTTVIKQHHMTKSN